MYQSDMWIFPAKINNKTVQVKVLLNSDVVIQDEIIVNAFVEYICAFENIASTQNKKVKNASLKNIKCQT